MSKTVDTLVPDIKNLLENPPLHRPDRDLVLTMINGMARAVLKPLEKRANNYSLRLSNIGRGVRKHWYESRFGTEQPDAESKMRFLVGDLMEEPLFFLAQVAGHKVEYRQKPVTLEGVQGHIDSIVDGHALVDGKTASDYGYKKFVAGLTMENDQYGYIYQNAAYFQGLREEGFELDRVGWLTINKSNSKFDYFNYPVAKLPDAKTRIITIKEALEKEKSPKALCEGAEPKVLDNGNKEMSMLCVFCAFKFKCWPEAKAYQYSNGPQFFTEVVKPPRVEEITNKIKKDHII